MSKNITEFCQLCLNSAPRNSSLYMNWCQTAAREGRKRMMGLRFTFLLLLVASLPILTASAPNHRSNQFFNNPCIYGDTRAIWKSLSFLQVVRRASSARCGAPSPASPAPPPPPPAPPTPGSGAHFFSFWLSTTMHDRGLSNIWFKSWSFPFWTLIHFENCEESLIPIKLSFINLKPGGGTGATMEHGKGRGKIRIRPNRPLGFADFEFRLCQWVSSRYYKILQDTILTMTLIGLYYT